MPRGRPKGKKSKFDALSQEYRDKVDSTLDHKQLDGYLSDVTKCIECANELKSVDPAYLEARAALDEVLGPYREDLKENKLKIKYVMKRLKEVGAVAGAEKPKTLNVEVENGN